MIGFLALYDLFRSFLRLLLLVEVADFDHISVIGDVRLIGLLASEVSVLLVRVEQFHDMDIFVRIRLVLKVLLLLFLLTLCAPLVHGVKLLIEKRVICLLFLSGGS